MPRRWYLSKKDTKAIRTKIMQLYQDVPLSFRKVEKLVEKGLPEILIVDDIPSFFLYEGKYFPLLTLLLLKGYEWINYVIVDEGAVKPLLRGADVMIPGIRSIKGVFDVGDPVVVVEEKYKKPFVVAKALLNSTEITSHELKKGKALENIHRIGDKLWKLVYPMMTSKI